MKSHDDKKGMALGKFSHISVLFALGEVFAASAREPDIAVRVSSQDREVFCQALYERFVKDPAMQARVLSVLQARQPAFTAPVFRREERDQINLAGVTPAPEGMTPSAMPSDLARVLLSHDVVPSAENGLSRRVPVTSVAAHIPATTLQLKPQVAGLRCVPTADGSRLRLELEFEQIEVEVPVQVGVTYVDPASQEQRFQELLIGAPKDGEPQPISGIRARVRVANPTLVLSLAVPERGTDVRAEDLQVLSTPSGFSADVSVPEDLRLGVQLPGGGAIGAEFAQDLRRKIESAAAEQAAERIGQEFQRPEFIAPLRTAALAEVNPLIARAREHLSQEVVASQLPLRLGLRRSLSAIREASEDFSPRLGRRDQAPFANADEVLTTRLMAHDAIGRLLSKIGAVNTFDQFKSDEVQDELRLAVELAAQFLREDRLAQNLLGRTKADLARQRLQWLKRKYAPDSAHRIEEDQMRGDLFAIKAILEDLRSAIPTHGRINAQAPIASDFSAVSARVQHLTRIHRQIALSRTFHFAVNEDATRLRGDVWDIGIDLLMNDLNGGQIMLAGRGCTTTEPPSPARRSSSVAVSMGRVNSMLGVFYEDGTLSELARVQGLDLTVPLQIRGTHRSNRFEMNIGVKKPGPIPIFSDYDFKGKLDIVMNPLADGSGVQIEVEGIKDLERKFDPRMILNPVDGVMSLLLGPLIQSVAESSFDEASGKMKLTLRSEELLRRGVRITNVYMDATDPRNPQLKVDYALSDSQALLAPPLGGGP